MIHIILGILKILGILLLAVLLCLLFLLLTVLFVPIRYQAEAVAEGTPEAWLRVTWLCRLVSLRAAYEEKKFCMTLRILGFYLIGGKKRETRARRESAASPQKTEKRLRETAGLHQEPEKWESEKKKLPERFAQAEDGVQIEYSIDTGETEQRGFWQKLSEKWQRLLTKLKEIWREICRRLSEIRRTAEKIRSRANRYVSFWNHPGTQAAYRRTKREAAYLLRHTLPRKVEADVRFGFEDPAATGQVLGALSVLEGFLGNRLQVEADFERQVLEGRAKLKGRIRCCHFAKAALGLLLDKNVRRTVGRFRRLHSGE